MNQLNAKTLVEALQNCAAGNQSITYINGKTDETTVSYGQLFDRARALLGYFQHNGVAPRSELVLYLENNEQFVDAFWGALLGKIIAVPLAVANNEMHYQKFFNVFRRLKQPRLFSTEKNLKGLIKFARNHGLQEEFLRISANSVPALENDVWEKSGILESVSPQDTAFIQFSSGSTGEPKGVVLTHRNLMVNVRSSIQAAEVRESDSSLSWMPLTHDMGIIGFHLGPLVANVNLFLMPTELFVRRPMLWLQKISEKRATITASPNFGYKHLLKRFRPGTEVLDLSCLRLILNGAEPISAELCREFCRSLAPFGYKDRSMFPVYGLAEASLAVTFTCPKEKVSSVHVQRNTLHTGRMLTIVDEAQHDTLELVRVGFPISGCEVKIVDSRDMSLSENALGHVLIRGDNVTSGYYDDENLNRQVFRDNGWLDTGDLGFINREQLVIAGRTKDLIIVNGQNFHPHDLELICERTEGIELGKVAACSVQLGSEGVESLVVFVQHRGDLEDFMPVRRQIKRLINETAGVDVGQVIPVRNIPKTTSGKPQRYILAEQFFGGDFDAVVDALDLLSVPDASQSPLAESSIQQLLVKICNSVIEDREVAVEDNLFEIGTSSLKLAQIHEQIEANFPGKLEVADLFENPSIAELAVVLENKH